ncbi:putative nicotinate phosphoribosyltransferase [Bacteriophage DSS3_MAL1]|nr:putative nicotinate phosphoribosyltransferase [Bacteriophage DSS3_MAL1]
MFDAAMITGLSPILTTDSYKTSHFNQYPAGATRVSSYIEPRGGRFDEAVFFGLQAFIKAYMMQPLTMEDVEFAAEFYAAHGVPFYKEGWTQIVLGHGGYLPVTIEAVPEGTVMGTRNVQVQVTSAPGFAWLTSYVETALLRAIWYPSTVASLSREAKKVILGGLNLTSDDPEGQIAFKLHDFGARGATSSEAAMLGGMGHLVNFMGTDTVEAALGARRFYNEPMAGFSIPATEHSTMTSWTRDGEIDAYRNLLRQYPTGLVACVSDSYDMMNAAANIWGGVLKDEVMARDGTLVIRPDSGDPTVMPLDVIEVLMDKFGYTVNKAGYKVLPDQVRVIQGDGMNIDTIGELISNAVERGISVDNFAMGMGGGLLQKVDRDTMKYAMKANAIEIDGKWVDVYKDPITDQGKKSKRGRLALVKRDGEFTTIRKDELVKGAHGVETNYLRPVYENGQLLVEDTFAAIRERAAI